MAEEQTIESGSNIENGVDYIEAIKTLKENTVAKEEYEKLRSENQKLLKSLVNGETIAVEQPKADIGELCNELCTEECDLLNLDYMKKRLELRDLIIAQGGPDTLVPVGHQISPTREDSTRANELAAIFQDCIDYADGDSDVFINELMRRTSDIPVAKKK